MESHRIHADQGHLGPIGLRQLSGCSNVHGFTWPHLLKTKGFVNKVTVSQAVKKVVWARSCPLTVFSFGDCHRMETS